MTPALVLARSEGERLARNPAIWLSFLLTAWWARSAQGHGEGEDRLFLLVGYGLLLPGFVMVTAVALATLRPRMERTEGLLGTMAVGADRRSIGHAASSVVCGAIGLVATTAIYIALGRSKRLGAWRPSDDAVIDVPRPNVAQLLQGPMAVVTVAVFVVAVVRWIPTWLVLLPLGFMVMVQGLFGGIFHSMTTDGERWLWPLNSGVVNGVWEGCATEDPQCDLPVSGFDTTTPWWHLAYLAALTAWFTTIAVLRHRRDASAWWSFGVASTLVVGCVSAQFAVADVFAVST